jgi:hypothetical protein
MKDAGIMIPASLLANDTLKLITNKANFFGEKPYEELESGL